MHRSYLVLGIFILVICTLPITVSCDNVNGGLGCAACTIIVGLTEQLATANNVSVVDLVTRQLCMMFPGQFNLLCGFVVTVWGQAVIEKLINNESPDVICYSLGICHVDPGENYCHLFPAPIGGFADAVQRSRAKSKIVPAFSYQMTESMLDICHLPGFIQVCDALASTFGSHNPAVDLDRDKFSVVEALRGSFWRGKDCDDVNEFIYPGRKPLFGDYIFDSNCNGISGLNIMTGLTYEKELCDSSDQRGVIYIGDSVGARFHLPTQWFIAKEITMNIFQNLSTVVSNQFDWPHLSFATGYSTLDWPILSGEASSIYQKLRERNLCNHRDYQNICFNGAETGTMLPFLESIARQQQRDKPALVFYALMGNDVCRRHQNTTDENITPQQFREHVLQSMKLLDTMLPMGSHVMLIGLVDGGFIYPTMSHRIHPIGQFRNDITYADVYDWWNCMHVGPCFGWMNRDKEFRDATSQRSIELTEVLKNIAAEETFNSFKIYFLKNPLPKVMDMWVEMGNELWTSLEPIDSMHPIQAIQPYITQVLWDEIMSKYPEAIGDINPNNDIIEQLFESQGGH